MPNTNPDLRRQRDVVSDIRSKKHRMPLVNSEIFVRSVRDSGYKSTATAIDEFVDNSVQAGAAHVDIVFGYDTPDGSTKNLRSNGVIAIADDGHGMDDYVIQFAVTWGGTHRHGDRSGFGRYGFGLPAAASSICKRFSVFSRVEGGDWNAVTVDIEEVARGKWTTPDGIVETPDAEPREPPAFVTDAVGDRASGTVVVLEDLDRLTSGYVLTGSAYDNLLGHLGTTYRGVLREVQLRLVDTAPSGLAATVVEPVDPLFLDPAARFYADGEINAEALSPTRIPVRATGAKKSDDPLGTVTVRYSYLPPGFQDGPERKARLAIMKESNGLLMLRAGRQLDVVRTTPKGSGIVIGQTYDRNWGCEIDFPPALDEEFGVTVNKQQVSLSDRMWSILRDHGVFSAVHVLQRRYADEAKERRALKEREAESEKASEAVAKKAAKHMTRKRARKATPADPTEARKEQEAFDREAERQARTTHRPVDEVRDEMLDDGYRIDFEHLPGAPHYRVALMGGQRQLWINSAHHFFTHIYSSLDATPAIRTALELLLLAQADCEIDALSHPERRRFYTAERSAWGRTLDTFLDILDEADPQADAEAAEAAMAEAQKDLVNAP